MNVNDTEIEAKFCLRDLPALEQRLQAAGAQLSAPRVFESNLRFDLPDGSLSAAGQVLRLRQDTHATLTFKGPPEKGADVAVRQEIETQVSDFAAAQRIFEALGYSVWFIYEKYRTTYRLDGMEIVLDELPLGTFCEIEAAQAGDIQAAAGRLGLDWKARIQTSYLGLFREYIQQTGFSERDLSFAAFKGVRVFPDQLSVHFAD